MRLCIYDQFIVGVVRPKGGWSKGRPIAYIEEDDRCVPLIGLLIPNALDDAAMARYVGDRFRAFSLPGRRVVALTHDPDEMRSPKPLGVARSSPLAGAQQ
jgi:hypothetical protein